MAARTTGRGHESETENLCTPNFYVYARCMVEAIMITWRFTLDWLRAKAANIGKGNEKEGVDGERA
eukprot:5499442-Pyramimonas_sp.AAC.1